MSTSLKDDFKQFFSLLRGSKRPGERNALGDNFRKFGTSFGAYEYEDYVALAQKFYHDALNSEDPLYCVVNLSGDRIAVDYNGEIRAVYSKYGDPIAFFRPSFLQLGYQNKIQELEDFRSGKNVAYL